MMLLQKANTFLRRITAFRSGDIPNNNHCCHIWCHSQQCFHNWKIISSKNFKKIPIFYGIFWIMCTVDYEKA
jgi:hypothetical protein